MRAANLVPIYQIYRIIRYKHYIIITYTTKLLLFWDRKFAAENTGESLEIRLIEFENKYMILKLIFCRFTLHQIKEKTISVYVSA